MKKIGKRIDGIVDMNGWYEELLMKKYLDAASWGIFDIEGSKF